ncbi:MAG: thioesterase domain-containing protein, partial [Longimicrobiales bacterium]
EKNDWGGAVSMIRQGGSLPPFFAIGSNHHFVDVANRVDPETPFYRLDVYALQSERGEEGKELYQTIEEIASRLVESIRSVEPTGPYYLGGACEGAFAAFEAAKQLQAVGEEVASLVLWFTVSPDRRRAGRRTTALPGKGIRRLRKLLRRSFMGRRTTKSLVQHERLRQRTFRAMDSYRPDGLFRGRLSLIQTIEDELALEDLTFGWKELATEGAEVRTMDGSHLLMLRDRPDEFGDHLEAFLQEARAEQGSVEATREIA